MMSIDRVLVTGISGFVGSVLSKRLVEEGVEVYGLVRDRADNTYKRLDELGITNKVTLIKGDLRDLYSLLNAIDISEPDVVFHLGAQSFVPRSFRNPIETYEVNTIGTANLLEAIRIKDIDSKFIFAGSSEEYGLQFVSEEHYMEMINKYKNIFPEPEKIPEVPIKETNPLRPMSPYAVSKVHGDFTTRNYYYSYGMKTIVSRAFNHEGALRGEQFVTSQIVKQVLEYYTGKRDFIELGNVNAFRDWSHVDDIVEGYILLAKRGRYGEVYNQGSGRTQSVLTYLLKTISNLKRDVFVYKVESISGDKEIKYPLEIEEVKIGDYNITVTKVDRMILEGFEFDLNDFGLNIYTSIGKFKIKFDPTRYRPSEVPILLANIDKIKGLGFKPTPSIDNIIRDQLNYYMTKII